MSTDSITYLEKLHEEPELSIWTVQINTDTTGSLSSGGMLPEHLNSGIYTLAISCGSAQIPSHHVETLCELPPLPGVSTLLAVTRGEDHAQGTPEATYYWYEPAEAGSFKALLEARGTLPLAEVAMMAQHLGMGLQSLNAAHIYPRTLDPARVMITVQGFPELLCLPDVLCAGMRQPQEQKFAEAHDLAVLLWEALTGEIPRETHQRIPLPLLAEVPDTLGLELERLLDDPDATVQEVIDVFDAFPAQTLNAYVSAPASVRSKLPVASRDPQAVKGAGNLPKTRRQNARRLIAKNALKARHNRPSKMQNLTTRKLMILGAVSLLILGAGAIAGAAWAPQAIHSHESHSAQPTAVQTPQDEQSILAQVLDDRNTSLDSQGVPALKLRSIVQISRRDSDSLKITAEVESPGYTPTETEQKEAGVHLIDGVPVQTVVFELQREEGTWRIVAATPVMTENHGGAKRPHDSSADIGSEGG